MATLHGCRMASIWVSDETDERALSSLPSLQYSESHPSSCLEPVIKVAARSEIAVDQEGKLMQKS